MNDLNPESDVRPGQLVVALVAAALFLVLLLAAVIAGGTAARGASPTGLTGEDSRRTHPVIVEPTDSLRNVSRPVVERDRAAADVCQGEGLVNGSEIDSAAEMRELIDTYCYPRARLAGDPDTTSTPSDWPYGLTASP